jgi:TonB family protein
MSQPESYGIPPSLNQKSWEKKSPGAVGEGFSAREVTDVFRTIAANGGGETSFDLAMDLVLNQVVEQARRETRATGAAIALARAGEMVCRATTGADAPDLGVRLETTSGLSGACLQTGRIQQCGDTETDARVNAEASRRLGVRSILIVPLSDGREPFGILEVFSSVPYAFGDGDISALQVLARRVVENANRGEQAAALLATEPGNSVFANAEFANEHEDAKLGAPAKEPKPAIDYEQLLQPEGGSPEDDGPARHSEVWSSILGVLVILVAVSLGLAVGWRFGIGQGLRGEARARTRSSLAGSSGKAKRTAGSAGETETVLAPVAGNGSVSAPKASSSATAVEPPSGGLVVTQNGKVIYRLPPAEKETGARTKTGPEDLPRDPEEASATRLIHRVEPEYPLEARTKHIQGVVTLDVQVGGDGAVHNIAVVEGDPVLAEAAVAAVRQWRYQPNTADGQPTEMQTRIKIRFTLPPS